MFAIAGFSGDFCVVARNGELATLNGIGFISIIAAVIFVGGIKLCAIGNGDVAIYFNCRGIIRIYCVHRCTLTCNNKVFRCSNPIAVSKFVCVVGAKISIYCDAILNGDITTLICFKRRTMSACAIEGKGTPLIVACDNEVYLFADINKILVNFNIGYRYITVDRDGYCIRAFSELKIRAIRFIGCKIPIVKIANFTIAFKFPAYSSNGDVLIACNYFRQGGGGEQDKD